MIITTAIALALIKGLFPTESSSAAATKETTLTLINITDSVSKEKSLDSQQKPKCPSDNIPFVSTSDCHACPAPCPDQDHLHYPSYLKMDYETPLLRSMKPYTRHVIISTGKDDWEHSIDEDKDSLAPHLQKAIDQGQERLAAANGGNHPPRIVLTNSSKLPDVWGGPGWQVTIFPDNIVVNNVTPDQCDDFFEAFLKPSVGSVQLTSHLSTTLAVEKDQGSNYHRNHESQKGNDAFSTSTKTTSTKSENGSTVHTITTTTTATTTTNKTLLSSSSSASSLISSSSSSPSTLASQFHHDESHDTTCEVTAGNTTFIAHKWKPKAVIMICSHKKRDKRCGVTAPILKKEFTRILRSKGIYGDYEGDVDIWLISHIGGHKFAGNVIVHKSEGMAVWYGLVEPCHTQAIVDATIEDGKVIKELYRGAMIDSFDQTKKKMAW